MGISERRRSIGAWKVVREMVVENVYVTKVVLLVKFNLHTTTTERSSRYVIDVWDIESSQFD